MVVLAVLSNLQMPDLSHLPCLRVKTRQRATKTPISDPHQPHAPSRAMLFALPKIYDVLYMRQERSFGARSPKMEVTCCG